MRWEIGAIVDRPAPNTKEEAAARWHARLADGGDARLNAEFQNWRAEEANDAAFDRMGSGQDAIRTLADAPEILSLRQQTLARLAMGKGRSRRGLEALLGGALAIVLVAVPIYALYRSGWTERPVIADAPKATEVAEQSFRTAVGQRMTLTLGDGSRVMLNTNSRIRVAYGRQERRLMLDAGQAWFEVAKHKPQPFVVFAGGQRVEAHGTAFDIRIRPDRTEVMLAEGKVSVRAQHMGSASVAMEPHQLLIAGATGTTLRTVADLSGWTNWREGVVRFDDTPLSQAVAEMNRYSGTQMGIGDAATGAIRVSGAFHTGATQAFVEALAIGFHIEGRRDGTGRILLRKTS